MHSQYTTVLFSVMSCNLMNGMRIFLAAYCEYWSLTIHEYLKLFHQLAHSSLIVSFCHRLNPWSTISDKLWYTLLCGNSIFWDSYKLTSKCTVCKFLHMKDLTMKTHHWVIYPVGRVTHSDFKIRKLAYALTAQMTTHRYINHRKYIIIQILYECGVKKILFPFAKCDYTVEKWGCGVLYM
jgi:hypothetical protein